MPTLTELIKESLEGKLSDQILASLEAEDKEMNEATVNPSNYYENLQIITRDTLLIDSTKHIGDDAQLKIYKPYTMRGVDIYLIYSKVFGNKNVRAYPIENWASKHPMKGWKLIPDGLLNTARKFTVVPYIMDTGKEPRLLVFDESRKEMRVLFHDDFFENYFTKLLLPYKFTHMNWLCNVNGVDNLLGHDDGGVVYDIVMNILKHKL